MRILIVEDEPLLAKKLQKLVLEIEKPAEIIGITNTIASTVNYLQANSCPDLILMDIELADGQSFEIFKQVELKCPVIFTTAYDEYALKAFKVNSIDYLLKPVKEEELRTALARFHRVSTNSTGHLQNPDINALLRALNKLPNEKKYRDRFLVKQGQKSFSVEVNDIAYFFTSNTLNYILTKTNEKFIVDYTLDEIEQALDPKNFFRANRQMVLSTSAVVAIHAWFNGKLKVDVVPPASEHVIISREKSSDFKAWLGE